MIYITGDCHGNYDRFFTSRFPEQKEMTKDDYVIVCGDFGYWNEHKLQADLQVLSQRKFTTLFIDGNHEQYKCYTDDFVGLNDLPVTEWHGGKAQIISGTDIIHLMRGEVYDIDGLKILAIGGAASHDITDGIIPYSENWKEKAKQWMRQDKTLFRVEGISWWKEENITDEDYQNALENIRYKTDKGRVDLVISHCAPSSALLRMKEEFLPNPQIEPDANSEYLEKILQRVTYKHWYFGHYHLDMELSGDKTIVYRKIIKVEM